MQTPPAKKDESPVTAKAFPHGFLKFAAPRCGVSAKKSIFVTRTKNIYAMIKSMTGFGKTTVQIGAKKVIIEIKSLNSKQLDLNLRLPSLYKGKEMEIRTMVKEALDRGKVDMSVSFDNMETDKNVTINKNVVMQ